MSERERTDAEVLAALWAQYPSLPDVASPADVEAGIVRMHAARPAVYETDHLRLVGRSAYLELSYESLHAAYLQLARTCLAATEDACAAASAATLPEITAELVEALELCHGKAFCTFPQHTEDKPCAGCRGYRLARAVLAKVAAASNAEGR